MSHERKQPEPEQPAGAPEWMVTFSDCMTLLLTFFVLLLSFSSFDNEDIFWKMNSSFVDQFSFDSQDITEKEAVSSIHPRIPDHKLIWGSEKPTLSEISKDCFKKQTEPLEFLRFQTFLISSQNIFCGNSAVLSSAGRQKLSDVALYLKELQNPLIVISENGSKPARDMRDIGFERAWAVRGYLITEQDLHRYQFSISATGTATKEYRTNLIWQEDGSKAERILEIVFLNRSL